GGGGPARALAWAPAPGGPLLPPPISSILLVIAVVPMGVLGARNRLRAVLAGTVAASATGFLVLGVPIITAVVVCGGLGAVVGIAARRGYGTSRTVALALTFLWPAAGAGAGLFLLVVAEDRPRVPGHDHNTGSGGSPGRRR